MKRGRLSQAAKRKIVEKIVAKVGPYLDDAMREAVKGAPDNSDRLEDDVWSGWGRDDWKKGPRAAFATLLCLAAEKPREICSESRHMHMSLPDSYGISAGEWRLSGV